MDEEEEIPSEEMQDDGSDLEKRIEEAKTPEELEAIEKELEGEKPAEEKPAETPPTEDKPVEDKPPQDKPAETPPTETPAEGGTPPAESAPPAASPEVGQLQEEIKKLKEQVDELTGEEKLQHEIDNLKKRMDNIVVQDDPNMNDSIYQSASKIAYVKRCLRRIAAKFDVNEIFNKFKKDFGWSSSDKKEINWTSNSVELPDPDTGFGSSEVKQIKTFLRGKNLKPKRQKVNSMQGTVSFFFEEK